MISLSNISYTKKVKCLNMMLWLSRFDQDKGKLPYIFNSGFETSLIPKLSLVPKASLTSQPFVWSSCAFETSSHHANRKARLPARLPAAVLNQKTVVEAKEDCGSEYNCGTYRL